MYLDQEAQEFVPTEVGDPCTICFEPVRETESFPDAKKKFFILHCTECGSVSNVRLDTEPYD